MPRIHPLTGWALIVTLIYCVAPGGLIHQGQKAINPDARSLFPSVLCPPVCDRR